MQDKILVVEDSIEFQKTIEMALGFKYKVECVDSLSLARNKVQKGNYSLILLDIMLPDGMGFDFCKEIQENAELSTIPVIFLTAKDSFSDKMIGFSLGADDYVTKPFDPAELLLRVDSRITKAQKKKYMTENIHRGPLRLEVPSMAAFLKKRTDDESRLDMTPIEFKILLKLVQNNEQVLSRQQLMDSVWGHEVYVEDRSIDKHISALRKKLNPFGDMIKTVSGVGYMFEPRTYEH